MQRLEKYVHLGDFDKAKDLYKHMDFHTFHDNLLEIAFDNRKITNYSFVVSLLSANECARLHHLAYLLLSQPLCHIEEAYISALYHAKKAVELTDEKDISLLENLLFLNIVPDKVVSDEEARRIAGKIRLIDSENEVANELLNRE